MKYIGKVCDKHPEFKGERYRWATGGSRCVGCHRDRLALYRSNDPKRRRKKKLAQSKVKYKEQARWYAKLSYLNSLAYLQDLEFVEKWLGLIEAPLSSPQVRYMFLKRAFNKNGPSFGMNKYHRSKMKDPVYSDMFNRRLDQMYEDRIGLPTIKRRRFTFDFWQRIRTELVAEMGSGV